MFVRCKNCDVEMLSSPYRESFPVCYACCIKHPENDKIWDNLREYAKRQDLVFYDYEDSND